MATQCAHLSVSSPFPGVFHMHLNSTTALEAGITTILHSIGEETEARVTSHSQPQAMWHRAFVLATVLHSLLAELAGSKEPICPVGSLQRGLHK